MSEKTYTAAEVAALLAAERAKASSAAKTFRCYVKSGTFKPTAGKRKGLETPFSHIAIEGNFYPAKLSFAAAEAILANPEVLRAALDSRTAAPSFDETGEQETPALANGGAPRLAAKS